MRRSPLARRSSFVALVVALGSMLAACGGGGHKSSPSTSSTQPKVLAVKTSVLRIGKVDVESAGPPNVQIDTGTGRAVLAVAQGYVDRALFAPLRTGSIDPAYGSLFDPGVLNAATGADERALTNVGTGKVDSFTTKANPVVMSALAGSLGELVYVATDFDLVEHVTKGATRTTLAHNVELTFAKSGKNWLVTAYRVRTVTTTADGTKTTTTAGGTTAKGGSKP